MDPHNGIISSVDFLKQKLGNNDYFTVVHPIIQDYTKKYNMPAMLLDRNLLESNCQLLNKSDLPYYLIGLSSRWIDLSKKHFIVSWA